jgi:hypothetical protein
MLMGRKSKIDKNFSVRKKGFGGKNVTDFFSNFRI